MERRRFIKTSAAALSLPFWLQHCDFLLKNNFPIYVHSDHETGHLMMKAQSWPKKPAEETGSVIVGGGLAGLSAAARLKDQDFKLFELSNRLGGTSSAQNHEGVYLSQGAHYDLAYPNTYGEDVLRFLEQLSIIEYEPWKKSWAFKDRQHVIPFTRRQQCYEKGKYRKEVIKEGPLKDLFYALMSNYEGKMHLPTRLIALEDRGLNDISFSAFLQDQLPLNNSFKQQVDYHMLDDWGGTTDQVSALAGIHYFVCRPYLSQSVDLFSPPEGNFYFIRKIAEKVTRDHLFTRHLVHKIEKRASGFEVEVLDLERERRLVVSCEQVIYAGQKHALKYIYPQEALLFNQTQTPWMIINFVCKRIPGKFGYWQNEFLGENPSFLGFIDSSVQDQPAQGELRTLTAYYCLKPEDRDYLTTIPEHKEEIVAETLSYIEEMLDEKLDVKACYIHVMGHAMSIPTPGFLFNDANDKNADLIYAGVDNGRLPLLFEAVDSGLMAAMTLS